MGIGPGFAWVRVALALLVPGLLVVMPGDGGGQVGLASLTAALSAGLAVVVVTAMVLVQLAPPAAPARVNITRLREAARHAAFLRLRDPDAAGRTRPRAPTPRSTIA